MTKFLIGVALILAAIYVIYFTDLFRSQTMQIFPTIRPTQASSIPRDPGMVPVFPVAFALDGNYPLNLVKVFVEEDYKTNKYPTPLWHLVSEMGSPPQKSIIYGLPIKNMKPAIPRARPQPLQPKISYLMVVESGKIRGMTNFFTKEASVPAR
jgi:hypothetical protein